MQDQASIAEGRLRALTLHPEWAWAIVHLDKRVENRSWRPPESVIPDGARFAIHAGSRIGGRDGDTFEALAEVMLAAREAGWEHEQVGAGWTLTKGGRSVALTEAAVLGVAGRVVAIAALREILPPREGIGDEPHPAWKVPGQYGWLLDDVAVLDYGRQPVIRGHQGLWRLRPGSVRF